MYWPRPLTFSAGLNIVTTLTSTKDIQSHAQERADSVARSRKSLESRGSRLHTGLLILQIFCILYSGRKTHSAGVLYIVHGPRGSHQGRGIGWSVVRVSRGRKAQFHTNKAKATQCPTQNRYESDSLSESSDPWDSRSLRLLANGLPVPVVETGQERRVTRRAMVALCNPSSMPLTASSSDRSNGGSGIMDSQVVLIGSWTGRVRGPF